MHKTLFHTVPFSQIYLKQERAPWLKVEGNSMLPFLRSGDRILIQPQHAASLKPGDLITFIQGWGLCTHRLMGRMKRGRRTVLLTKGDLSCRWDQPIPVEAVLGKVIAIQKGDQTLSMERAFWLALNPLLVVLSIGIGALLYLKWKISHSTAYLQRHPTLPGK